MGAGVQVLLSPPLNSCCCCCCKCTELLNTCRQLCLPGLPPPSPSPLATHTHTHACTHARTQAHTRARAHPLHADCHPFIPYHTYTLHAARLHGCMPLGILCCSTPTQRPVACICVLCAGPATARPPRHAPLLRIGRSAVRPAGDGHSCCLGLASPACLQTWLSPLGSSFMRACRRVQSLQQFWLQALLPWACQESGQLISLRRSAGSWYVGLCGGVDVPGGLCCTGVFQICRAVTHPSQTHGIYFRCMTCTVARLVARVSETLA